MTLIPIAPMIEPIVVTIELNATILSLGTLLLNEATSLPDVNPVAISKKTVKNRALIPRIL